MSSADIRKKYLCDMKKVADAILPHAITLDGRGRTGGYLCVADRFGIMIALFLVGHIDNRSHAQSCFEVVQRKVLHLNMHPHHVSGWQIRNEANGDLGGSIRDRVGNVYAFHGFNEHIDEAFSLAVAFGISDDEMPEERQNEIVSISGNRHAGYLCVVGDVLPFFLVCGSLDKHTSKR